MVVLDTDHLSILEWESGTTAQRLLARLSQVAPDEAATTIINFEEQMRGWLAYLARTRTLTQHSRSRIGRCGQRNQCNQMPECKDQPPFPDPTLWDSKTAAGKTGGRLPLGKVFEHGLGLLQIFGVKALSEPVVDLSQ